MDLRQRIAEGRAGPDVLREADRLVLAEHGPPGAIIDDEMNIVQVRGRTAPYLELSPGEPTQNLLKLAREGLIAGLGKAIRLRRQTNAAAKEDGFRIEDGGQLNDVTIKVIPFRGPPSSKERYFLVLFEDAEPNGGPQGDSTSPRYRTTGEAPGCGANWSQPKSICNRSSRIMPPPWKSSGRRTKRRRRAMRNWKPRRKSWNRPTKN